MGFERLCMALQGKKSNYDTDVFTGMIAKIEELSGHKYGVTTEADVAMRVIADHLRAISFSIADGQLPSNVKAGYVIRPYVFFAGCILANIPHTLHIDFNKI